MIVFVDNYDSFVHNLARYFQRLGQETVVLRNDRTSADDIQQRSPQAIVLSPGPCTPKQAGCCEQVVRQLGGQIPILGVCLGHQAIATALGAKLVQSPRPVHGQTSTIAHDAQKEFHQLPNPLKVCRYHSLVVERTSLPRSLEVTAWTIDDNPARPDLPPGESLVMGLRHRQWPLVGWQFHPEALLTDQGFELLRGFLQLAQVAVTLPCPTTASERPIQPKKPPLPTGPVTF